MNYQEIPILLIFDCDGTLVDSQQIIVQTMQETFDDHGLPAPERQAVAGVIGLSLAVAIERLFAEPMAGDAEAMADHYRKRFHDTRASKAVPEPLYPGARETMEALISEDAVLLGIATGKSRRGVDELLHREGWAQHFLTIQTADDAPSKPHPAMVHQALAETGTDAGNAALIGDSIYDMQMARSAGVAAIGVAWGFNPVDDLMTAGAEVMAGDFADLAGIIGRFRSTRQISG